MKNFEFYNPVRVIFGKDQLNKLSTLIPEGSKVLMIYGGGSIKNNGVYDGVKNALVGYEVYEFQGIEPNPRFETSMKAVELIKEHNIDYLLAVGGGSVIDATKFIAAAAEYTGDDPWDILSKSAKVLSAKPFGVVLTLPATGSEMNTGSVITKEETKEKFAFMTPLTYPKFSFLLPEAAGSLPKTQVANGIVDAFVHVVEQYVTYPAGALIQDRYAESILQTLIEIAPTVYDNPSDYEAMGNLMWSATMALNGLIGLAVPQDWGVHTIGHELTALHEIDHARTLAIILPGYWNTFRIEKREKLLQFAERVWNITETDEEEKITKAIKMTEEFFNSVGIKTKLNDYNLGEDTVNEVAERLQKRGWVKFGDRGLVTIDKVKEILIHQLK